MTDVFDFESECDDTNNVSLCTSNTLDRENDPSILSSASSNINNGATSTILKRKKGKRRIMSFSKTTTPIRCETSPITVDSHCSKSTSTGTTNKVRFSADTPESDPSKDLSSVSRRLPSSNVHNTDSSFRMKKKGPARRKDSKGGWLNDDVMSRSSSLSSSTFTTPRNERKKMLRTPISTGRKSNSSVGSVSSSAKLRRVRMDAFAVQDAGNYQMIRDEFIYICSTITSNLNGLKVMKATTLDAVIELALMLSSKDTRCLLFQQLDEEDCENTVQMILDVLSKTTYQIAKENNRFDKLLRKQILTGSESEEIDWSQGQGSQMSQLSQLSQLSQDPEDDEASEHPKQLDSFSYSLLTDALASIAHFLSWDCTINKDSVFARSPRNAGKIRNMILQHSDGMRAIAQAMLSDPLVRNIVFPRRDGGVIKSGANDGSSINNEYCDSNLASQETTGSMSASSAKDDMAAQRDESTESVVSEGSLSSVQKREDPTVKGRIKRKRRRMILDGGGTPLQPIPEQPPSDVLLQPDSRSSLSFSSSEHLKTGIGAIEDDAGSVMSSDSVGLMINEKMGRLHSLSIFETNKTKDGGTDDDTLEHTCCGDVQSFPTHSRYGNQINAASLLALSSLKRIVSITEECHTPDNNCANYNQSSSVDQQSKPPEDSEDSNPMVVTNNLIGKSSITSLLSQAMTETLICVTREIDNASETTKLGNNELCLRCIRHLHDRCLGLASLIDDACLFNDKNRRDFCEGEEDDNGSFKDSFLISSLVRLLKSFVEHREVVYKNQLLCDILLSALRTLTSLTHDNDVAADQLSIKYKKQLVEAEDDDVEAGKADSWQGVEVLVDVLYQLAEDRKEKVSLSSREDLKDSSKQDKVKYDIVIFCLNTLANVAETDEIRSNIAEAIVPAFAADISKDTNGPSSRENNRVAFVSWLAQWIVHETESFRDALMEGSFGGKASSSARRSGPSRGLKKDEDDLLVIAGNGCVLLAALVVDPDDDDGNNDVASWKVTSKMRDLILEVMPCDAESGQTSATFMKNTLKAFSNFLYYSMGALSVAVVVPVRALIEKLDKIKY